MKLTLDRIDTRGLTLVPPGGKGDVIGIASTTNLRGAIVVDDGALSVRDAKVDELALATLRLTLGSLVLVAPAGAKLVGVSASVDQRKESLSLEVTASSLEAPELTIIVDDVAIKGRAALEGVRLVVRGDEGSIAAGTLDVQALAVRIDDTEIRTDAARGTNVAIGWGGADGFRLDAETLGAPALLLALPGVNVAANGVAIGSVALRGEEVAVGRASLDTTRVHLALSADNGVPSGDARAPARGPPASEAATGPSQPLLDWRLLDGLHGNVDVDVAVDLKVPILGRRNATHELRIPIDRGTIDYRELERNLSALEDAILDFSVRENALVLERVNPLLPLRGHGKPIVAWSLEGDDVALAERDRVRLSVLPGVSVVGADEEPSSEPSPVALKMLRLLNLRARLVLEGAPVDAIGGSLRVARVGSLQLDGEVHYDPGTAAPPGALRGQMSELAACLYQLAIDDESMLDVAELAIGAVSSMEIDFADVSPTAVRVEASRVTTNGVALKPKPGRKTA